jgi:hypothetical protein
MTAKHTPTGDHTEMKPRGHQNVDGARRLKVVAQRLRQRPAFAPQRAGEDGRRRLGQCGANDTRGVLTQERWPNPRVVQIGRRARDDAFDCDLPGDAIVECKLAFRRFAGIARVIERSDSSAHDQPFAGVYDVVPSSAQCAVAIDRKWKADATVVGPDIASDTS